MSTVRFISDLHFDHKNIPKYSGDLRHGDTVEEHDQWVIDQWNSVVTKQDVTWVLGDVSFSRAGIEKVKRLNGVKHLILGNHDTYPLKEYLKYFNKVHGFQKYKGFWLSHAPIKELRGIPNIHGHTHSDVVIDGRHICVSVEALQGRPISLEEITSKLDPELKPIMGCFGFEGEEI